ncbi:MAG: phosphoribosylaminoimidazolesuccinocarboxamide synthase [Candidatus Micrarchaeota archaeon]|nr:phosphoribosylaminoimidazolesuccinocarboxamide synthase [Candidatus Micrarchaeota archaeon]
MDVITKTSLPLEKFSSGKVRDTYVLDSKTLLMVCTDRISAFDVVFEQGIPYKGVVLNQLSIFWFNFLKSVIDSHYIKDFSLPKNLQKRKERLELRAMAVKRAKPIKLECVVRGYLAGSGYKEYLEKQSVCSIPLPSGLKLASKLPEPIFTPSTKADVGHDQNISYKEAEKLVGKDTFEFLKEKSIEIYTKASDYALKKGIILADTKFEFGFFEDKIILIDEVLTPDSSRYWDASTYKEGISPPSFDKQYVRDYLESTGWNKTPPAPPLPPNIIKNTTKKYIEAYEKLVGKKFSWR